MYNVRIPIASPEFANRTTCGSESSRWLPNSTCQASIMGTGFLSHSQMPVFGARHSFALHRPTQFRLGPFGSATSSEFPLTGFNPKISRTSPSLIIITGKPSNPPEMPGISWDHFQPPRTTTLDDVRRRSAGLGPPRHAALCGEAGPPARRGRGGAR